MFQWQHVLVGPQPEKGLSSQNANIDLSTKTIAIAMCLSETRCNGARSSWTFGPEFFNRKDKSKGTKTLSKLAQSDCVDKLHERVHA